MPVIPVRDFARASLFSLPLLLVPAAARGADPAASATCASSYENAQLLRQRGKRLAARDQASICARDQCPEIGRRDCAHWAEELAHEVPSVVVVVRDEADRDVVPQRLLVDGAPRAEVTSGRAFELDPGSHVFRVERANAPPVERPFTVYQGERDRLLRITVPRTDAAPGAIAPAPAVAPTASTAGAAPAPGPTPPAPRSTPSYTAAAIVTGVSAASLGVSAYLGLTGRHDLSTLRSSCAPTCTDAQVDPVHTRLTLSDVTLGAGIVGAAIAVYLFARTGSERGAMRGALVEIAPIRDGAAAMVGGRF